MTDIVPDAPWIGNPDYNTPDCKDTTCCEPPLYNVVYWRQSLSKGIEHLTFVNNVSKGENHFADASHFEYYGVNLIVVASDHVYVNDYPSTLSRKNITHYLTHFNKLDILNRLYKVRKLCKNRHREYYFYSAGYTICATP